MIYAYIQYAISAAVFALFLWVLLVPVWQVPRVIRMYMYFYKRNRGISRWKLLKEAWKWVN